MPPYLQAVLLLAMLVVCQAEAQRVPCALNQHQRGALPREPSASLELPTPAPTRVPGTQWAPPFPAFPTSLNPSIHWGSWHPPCSSIPASTGVPGTQWAPHPSPSQPPVLIPHRDVALVDIVVTTALGDEQGLVKEEEGTVVAHPLCPKCTLQHQLPVACQVRPLPAQQQ